MHSTVRPTIAVVVTCYNLGRYLDEAVDSVLAQTFQDFEIVVVDDGSTDPATRRLLERYDRPKTRVVRSENRGLPAARNLGIRETTGSLVCALDADDTLEPTYFEKAAHVLASDPSIAFVSHWLRYFGEEAGDWTPVSCDLQDLLLKNTVNGAALVRRAALEAVGGFDETMTGGCEDWDLWLTMLESGYRGTIIPEVLFYYRRRSDSMSRLMLNGYTHAGLFRRLVEKHERSYREHLPGLLRVKDADIAILLRETHDLEFDHRSLVEPGLRRAREEVAALQAAAAHIDARSRIAPEHVAAERQQLAERIGELEQTVDALRFENAALRTSLTWRLTGPFRAVAARLSRLRGAGR